MSSGRLRRPILRRGLALFGGLAVSLSVASASAQGASDKAAAEALFDEGVRLLKAGKYDDACRRLESSQRIDPGIGTLLYLADCYEKSGRTASAWATFREAASAGQAAGQDDRARIGRERAKRLEPKLSRLTLTMAEENRAIEDVEVHQGPEMLPKAIWGTPVPVDPGELTIRVTAPGYEPFEGKVTVDPGGSEATFAIPALTKSAESEPEPEATQSEAGASASISPVVPADAAPSDGSFQRTSGLVVAGLGVVGIGVGTFFGFRAISENDEALKFCGGSTCTDQRGIDHTEDAQSAAMVSNIAFIAGGLALAGGVVLYATAPEPEEATRFVVHPTVGGASMSVGGHF